MLISFFRGKLKLDPRDSVTWAETPFGLVTTGPVEYELRSLHRRDIRTSELIFHLDLPDIPREHIETIAVNLIRLGLTELRNAGELGESLLFRLVNESLHELEHIAAKESG